MAEKVLERETLPDPAKIGPQGVIDWWKNATTAQKKAFLAGIKPDAYHAQEGVFYIRVAEMGVHSGGKNPPPTK